MAAEQSSHRFESNEVFRWGGGESVTVTGVGDPGHGDLAEGYEHSVLLHMRADNGDNASLDLDAHEARRIAAALVRAADAVSGAS